MGKYTAYGSMIYTHTALHLASRNGHTRFDYSHIIVSETGFKLDDAGSWKSCSGSGLTSMSGQLEERLSMRRRSVERFHNTMDCPGNSNSKQNNILSEPCGILMLCVPDHRLG